MHEALRNYGVPHVDLNNILDYYLGIKGFPFLISSGALTQVMKTKLIFKLIGHAFRVDKIKVVFLLVQGQCQPSDNIMDKFKESDYMGDLLPPGVVKIPFKNNKAYEDQIMDHINNDRPLIIVAMKNNHYLKAIIKLIEKFIKATPVIPFNTYIDEAHENRENVKGPGPVRKSEEIIETYSERVVYVSATEWVIRWKQSRIRTDCIALVKEPAKYLDLSKMNYVPVERKSKDPNDARNHLIDYGINHIMEDINRIGHGLTFISVANAIDHQKEVHKTVAKKLIDTYVCKKSTTCVIHECENKATHGDIIGCDHSRYCEKHASQKVCALYCLIHLIF